MTSSPILWSSCEDHINQEHIYFSEISKRNLSVQDYITMQIARDLLYEQSHMTLCDLADGTIVSENMFRLYLKAIMIKRYGMKEVAAYNE